MIFIGSDNGFDRGFVNQDQVCNRGAYEHPKQRQIPVRNRKRLPMSTLECREKTGR